MKTSSQDFDNSIWYPYGKPNSADTLGNKKWKKIPRITLGNYRVIFSVTKSSIFQQVQRFKLMPVSWTTIHSFMGLFTNYLFLILLPSLCRCNYKDLHWHQSQCRVPAQITEVLILISPFTLQPVIPSISHHSTG